MPLMMPREERAVVYYGLDVSHHNAEAGLPLDWWRAVRAAGAVFAFAKATQGTSVQDPAFAANITRMRAAGLMPGAYHYLSSADTIDAQVDYFLACLLKAGISDLRGVLTALDTETGSGDVAHANDWRAAWVRKVGSHPLVNYLPRWYWTQVGGGDTFAPLWASRYRSAGKTLAEGYAAVAAGDWDSYGGADVAVLQYTDSAVVAGRQVDANAYRGSFTALWAMAGSTPAKACSAALTQATARWPGRAVGSDGIMASAGHLATSPSSDHNLGNAFDLTHDPAHGVDSYALARALADRARAGTETRVTYLISNREMCSFTDAARSRGQWGVWVAYSGADPHTGHAHVSIKDTTATRADTSAWWGGQEVDMGPDTWDDAGFKALADAIRANRGGVGAALCVAAQTGAKWNEYIDEDASGTREARTPVDIGFATHRAAVTAAKAVAALAAAGPADVDEAALAALLAPMLGQLNTDAIVAAIRDTVPAATVAAIKEAL